MFQENLNTKSSVWNTRLFGIGAKTVTKHALIRFIYLNIAPTDKQCPNDARYNFNKTTIAISEQLGSP